jgi:hypothetical protein
MNYYLEGEKVRVPVSSYRRYSIDMAFPNACFSIDRPKRKFTEEADFQLVFQKSFNNNLDNHQIEIEIDDDYVNQFLH